jgi:hypothetical protein
MPCDPRTAQALEALAGPRAAFHSAVAAAVGEVGAYLAARRGASADGRVRRTADELGAFAAGRIDVERFSTLLSREDGLDPLTLARVERAHQTLVRLVEGGDALYCARVPAGGDLRDTVGEALARVGRAFSAARAVETVRSGRPAAKDLDESAAGFAFRRWNRAEKRIAPPLVVEVAGADLQVGGLAEFLDGAQKIVLLISGEAPPAPLARLITPGVLVMQSADPGDLARVASTSGPAIAALVPEGAARFVHTPGAEHLWARIEVQQLPDDEPRGSLGALSAFQRTEELGQLRALVTAPPAPAEAEPPQAEASTPAGRAVEPSPPDPADRLASWLLSQAAPDRSS